MRFELGLQSISRRTRISVAILIGLVLALWWTRGGDDPVVGNRIEVSGRVDLDGKPLKSGRIHFAPGNGEGPSTAARIDDGAYRVERADGPAPGAYTIRITTGEPPPLRPPPGQVRPPPRVTYQFSRSLSSSAGEQNFTLTPDAILTGSADD
jgi:hypothetical protein